MFVLVLFVLSFIAWIMKKYVLSTVAFFLVTCNAMGLAVLQIGDSVLELHNYIFIFANFIIIIEIAKSNIVIDIKKDPILKILVYGYLFFIIHSLLTVLLGIDTFRYANAVLRVNVSSLLLYFLTYKLSKDEISKILNYIGIIVVIHTICYLLQYVGVFLFQRDDYYVAWDAVNRIGNPSSCAILFIISLYVFQNKWKTLMYVLPMIGGSSRGVITSLVAAFTLFYYKRLYKVKYILTFIVCVLIGIYCYDNFLQETFDRRGHTFVEELTAIFDLHSLYDFNSYYAQGGMEVFDFNENSTFAFRISLLLERFFYLLQHPQYLLFGVGSIAEVSPNNRFSFILGTVNDLYKSGYCMIDSNDIMWSSIVLRYGLSGIFFWILFLRKSFKVAIVNINSSIYCKLLSVYLYFFIFNSFGSDGVIRPANMLIFYLVLSYCMKERNEYLLNNKISRI